MNLDDTAFPATLNEHDDSVRPGLTKLEWAAIKIAEPMIRAGRLGGTPAEQAAQVIALAAAILEAAAP